MKVGSLLKLLLFLTLCAAIIPAIVFYSRIKKIEKIIQTTTSSPHWHSRIDLFRNDPIDENAIILLGDDMIEHFKPALLSNDRIVNRGIAGDFTKSILLRLDEITLSHPEKVFIMAGINDIREKMPLFMISHYIKKIVNQINTKTPETKIYIQSILPVAVRDQFFDPDQQLNNKIQRMNNKLSKLCTRKNITYIDLYPLFEKDGELKQSLRGDMNGINDKGYRIWSEYLRQFVEK